ncbi:hypothetical protein HanIR_Chr04g0168651 [Helianthus annuus]|nr:hypothetical protein HanIR_Chr04g0168651 [Helianthus annuus]
MNMNLCSVCVREQFANMLISLMNEHEHGLVRVRSVRLQPYMQGIRDTQEPDG